MALADLTRKSILKAIAEYRRLGQQEFLARYGFGPARNYFLVHAGRDYPSKAIAGVAHGYLRGRRALRSDEFAGGDQTVRRALSKLGFVVEKRSPGDGKQPGSEAIAVEESYRRHLWKLLLDLGDPTDVEPEILAEIGIRPARTGHGVFCDKQRTRKVYPPHGVTLCLLDLGDTYEDAFDEKGGIYYFPSTRRSGGRDLSEIEATKNAQRARLPVFVVLPGKSASTRCVRLGWVREWDDEARTFLISFEESAPVGISKRSEEPFKLRIKRSATRTTRASSRPGQSEFRFRVQQRYGASCGVCALAIRTLLDAAHICPVSENGTDDPRNGLVLCKNHHQAFDSGYFGIHPKTLKLKARESGPTLEELGIRASNLRHLPARPHREALLWRWKSWQKKR